MIISSFTFLIILLLSVSPHSLYRFNKPTLPLPLYNHCLYKKTIILGLKYTSHIKNFNTLITYGLYSIKIFDTMLNILFFCTLSDVDNFKHLWVPPKSSLLQNFNCPTVFRLVFQSKIALAWQFGVQGEKHLIWGCKFTS